MSKMILLGVTVVIGVSAPFVTYAQSKSTPLTQIIESVNRNKIRMRYFRDKTTNLILTRSDADILSDGDITKVPKEKRINDIHRQNQLYSGIKLNPYAVNYTVIPDEMRHRVTLKNNGIKMRCLYYVTDIKTGKSSFGIVADIGPGGQVTNGEFSVHQILELSLPVDKPTGTGGKDANDIVTVIFPNSDGIISLNDINRYIDEGLQGALQNRINEEGSKLLKKYSESHKAENLNKLIEAIKAETTAVKNYD
jgi:Fungal chitosanase of glycosyl hydrolase group 75